MKRAKYFSDDDWSIDRALGRTEKCRRNMKAAHSAAI